MMGFKRFGKQKKLIFLLWGVSLILSLAAKPIKLLEENDNYLLVRFDLPQYELEEIEKNGDLFQIIHTSANNQHSETGKPLLPYFSEIIGIPADGNITLEIIKTEQSSISDINIFPTEAISPGNKQAEYQFSQDQDLYSSNRYYPHNLLQKGEKSILRDRSLISFKINPFQFNPQKNTLKVTKSLVAKIYISGDKSTSRSWRLSNNYIDKAGSNFFLNNQTSQRWRVEREPVANYPESRNLNLIEEIQLVIANEGIYKVTRENLENAVNEYMEEHELEMDTVFDWDEIDPRFLELYDEDGPVPVRFVGENDASFDAGDYFEFYGNQHHGEESYYDDYTNENTYRLKIIDHIASRMAVENGGIQNSNPSDYIVPTSFEQVLHLEEQNTYAALGDKFRQDRDYYREDLWFWSSINAPDLKIIPFQLQYPHDSNLRKFEAKACLFGASFIRDNPNQINHSALVRLNSSLIDSKQWAGQQEVFFENQLPLANSHLNHGENNLFISLPGVPGVETAQVLFDYLQLKYWREYKTDDDYIQFSKPSNRPLGLYQFEIDNFSSPNISVYKIGSSYFENTQVTSFTEAGLAPFKLTFQDSIIAENYQYFAVTEEQKKQPIKIVPNIPSDLKSNQNSAEYVIITVDEFAENEGTLLLKELRESEGYATKIVKLQDIFDQFNSGIRSIEALKDFVSYAYHNWSAPVLTHVLLLGDGINDERDFSSDREYNLIPFRKIWATQSGAIASDNWLGCVVGDDMISDVSISRISVWDAEQILPIAQKSLNYKENPNFQDLWHSSVTLAAGGNPSEGTYFAKQSERIRSQYIPQPFKINRVYANVEDLPAEYAGNTTSLLRAINDGTVYLQFMGHGGGHVWADYNLLNLADINTFNNDNYPFVASLSCYGSAFNYRQSSCIGEELTLVADKGAIAQFGFTGYGYKIADEVVGNYLNQALFQLKLGNLGNITDYAKARFYADSPSAETTYALVQCGVLLGDHMATVVSPEIIDNIEIADSHLNPGDTLYVNTEVEEDIFQGKYVIYDENDAQLGLNTYFPLPIFAADGSISVSDFTVPLDAEPNLRNLKLFAFGNDRELCGEASFTIGRPSVQNLEITPTEPTAVDSVMITADFISDSEIENINLIVFLIDGENVEIPINSYQMEWVEGISYQLQNYIPPQTSSTIVRYYFAIETADGETYQSQRFHYNIQMADLFIQHHEISANQGQPVFKLFTGNLGQQNSLECFFRLYQYEDSSNSYSLIDSTLIDAISPGENSWNELVLPLYTEPTKFKATVNEERAFPEPANYNNNEIVSQTFEFNLFEAGLAETTAASQDGNLQCEFPAGLLEENSVFYINEIETSPALNQPDISQILLADSLKFSAAYEIGAIDQAVLADSLGHFADGKSINLKFYYSESDSLVQVQENSNNFEIYRYEPHFQKWISKQGNMSLEQDFVTVDVERAGIYAIFQNQDTTQPFVEANVEGQEFTYGGYVAHNGIISMVLSDANGIDLFDNKVQLFLNGSSTPLDESDYNMTVRKGNLTHIPIKYQLDLNSGDHFLTVDCTDVNGNLTSHEIKFTVNEHFELLNVANYPNPVKSQTAKPVNEGRTRFTYVLTDDADKVEIKVYTVSGRLVKTFEDVSPTIGYHEHPRTLYGWDCRDDKGYPLANGVYFYKITAKKGNKTVSKTMKMAILK